MHSKSSQERIKHLMSSGEQDTNKFTLVGHNTNSVAETFVRIVVVICNQLSNIPGYIFRNCDLLVLNKSHERKLQVKNNSSADCHTEGLIMVLKGN